MCLNIKSLGNTTPGFNYDLNKLLETIASRLIRQYERIQCEGGGRVDIRDGPNVTPTDPRDHHTHRSPKHMQLRSEPHLHTRRPFLQRLLPAKIILNFVSHAKPSEYYKLRKLS